MREIKFRAWHPEEKKMWIDVGTDGCGGVILDTENMGLKPLKGESILMQYTGLKDKNDKEIYEGDILRKECCSLDDPAYGCYGEEYEVLYDAPRTAAFILVSEEQTLYLLGSLKYEVISNIYENPELI